MTATKSTTPRAIVLLSDGTGNSAAKLFKTNVWRLYQALDLTEPSTTQRADGAILQVAYYDDGVGTSAFRPLALIGGAFGWGLKRNVLDLYTFLCRNYRDGDRIYAFGFSRGAFTIRILIGLVVRQGLVQCATEQELARYSADAYRAYRRRFKLKWSLVDPLRDFRDAAISAWRRFRRQKLYGDVDKLTPPDIAFAGVWDTVAAYGMPIAELTRGIDAWVWPLSMPNYVLSERVKMACHALALDDERDTFHPLLWDEVEEQKLVESGKVAPDRIRQVWFAGMHSDVGGGYPDDALSYIPLDWVMAEAAAAGLRFKHQAIAEIKFALHASGPMHDSRRGVAAYYRYQPRKVSARIDPPDPTTLLMRDPDLGGRGLLASVKIHESVLKRIRSGPDRYAPIVLPDRYVVVGSTGSPETVPEMEAAAQSRADRQEWVWNDVWKRRVNYFTTLGVSLFLVLLPWISADWSAACVGPQCLLTPIIASAGAILPGIMQTWIRSFAQNPGVFALAIAIIALLLMRSTGLQRQIHDDMRQLWDESLELTPVTGAGPPKGKPDNRIYRLRTSRAYLRAFQVLKWRLAPTAFGIGLLVLIAMLAAFVIYRTVEPIL